jgi:hypothetical protein
MQQISNQNWQPVSLILCRAVFDCDVLALDETCFLQALAERGHKVSGIGERCAPKKPDHRPLLRARRERPCSGRAAERG